MRLTLVLLAVGVILPAQTRSRKAHEHGSAKVSIAFETAKGAPKGVVGNLADECGPSPEARHAERRVRRRTTTGFDCLGYGRKE